MEWATLALYDDASGLDDAEEQDARLTLRNRFEDHGYRVQNVQEDDGEPLEGRWRGLFAEGCTAAFLGVADDVMAADAAKGIAAYRVNGLEYVLEANHETVVWIPEAWTGLILTGRWERDMTIDWDPALERVIGPEAYNRWAAEGPRTSLPRQPGSPPWRPMRLLHPQAGHTRSVKTGGVKTDETAWIATDRPRVEGGTVYPGTAPPLPHSILEEIADNS